MMIRKGVAWPQMTALFFMAPAAVLADIPMSYAATRAAMMVRHE